jgi:FAD/FMN-containing dehydrogenase/Fe-S oxidoreductase
MPGSAPRTPAAPLYTRAGVSAVNSVDLAADLDARLDGDVRFDAGSRALYATDASNYRQVPLGVVVPRHTADVLETIDAARRSGAPIFSRGAGTSLAGQCCNTGVVIDFSRYVNRVIDIDAGSRTARVEPGLVLDGLRAAAASHGLTFGPDPATHRWCTLGGMIGNNSCGVHSVMADFHGPGPTTADNVEALDVVTYRGLSARVGVTDDATFARIVSAGGPVADLYRRLRGFQQHHANLIRRECPKIPRRVSGYNLPALLPENGFHIARALVGSESTLVTVLQASVRLIPALPHRALVVVGFDDVFAAADHVPDVLRYRPVGLEGFDDNLAEDLRRAGLAHGNLRLLPDGRGWLLVEFGAESVDEAKAGAAEFVRGIHRANGVRAVSCYDAPEDQARLWEIRESGLAATARVGGERPTWPGWEDSAVPPERFGDYLRDVHGLFQKHGYHADLYGHFGQGCLHCRVDFELRTADGIAQFRRFLAEAADLVHRYGGSLSGEHGDGQARGELLGRMFSPEMLGAFREFKSIWDPDWMMNPGKVIDARPVDADLRLTTARAEMGATTFQFPEDSRSFVRVTERCVGVGKCRADNGGTMCPSYMVTREEKHSTRGRARLLFEMMVGDPLDGGWKADEVKEALDLCLACKGCKGECPVHVDMATYKAEFLAHYYTHRWRPRWAYAFGLIHDWARLASVAPRLVNTVMQTPRLGALLRAATGIAPERRVPAFASQSFRGWFRARTPAAGLRGQRVVLWPDTFNENFHPGTLRAAVEVLERAGFRVELPRAGLCCGRPLYDYGMLNTARRRLRTILEALREPIDAGVPVVGLEPSCVAVFRDELVNMLPDVDRARRLGQQTFTLAELLVRRDTLPALRLSGNALVHGHCHQKALFGMDAERQLLDRSGLRYEVLDSGCCGMAGSFGFERDHYAISLAVGERRLLPAVRHASAETLVIADGFSCREQIAQATPRRAMHLAEVVRLAMRTPEEREPAPPATGSEHIERSADVLTRREVAGALVLTAGLGLFVAAAWLRRRAKRA